MVRRAAAPVRARSPMAARCWRRRRWAPTSPISARRSSRPTRRNAVDAYKQGIVEGRADDIVYSSLFTGVHGNYLRQSIEAAGLDPNNLPEGDIKHDGLRRRRGRKKAWRDIWGSGQGIGAVTEVLPAADYVAKLAAEYRAGQARAAGESSFSQRQTSRPPDPRPPGKTKPLRRSAGSRHSPRQVWAISGARPAAMSTSSAMAAHAASSKAGRSCRRSRPSRPRRAPLEGAGADRRLAVGEIAAPRSGRGSGQSQGLLEHLARPSRRRSLARASDQRLGSAPLDRHQPELRPPSAGAAPSSSRSAPRSAPRPCGDCR